MLDAECYWCSRIIRDKNPIPWRREPVTTALRTQRSGHYTTEAVHERERAQSTTYVANTIVGKCKEDKFSLFKKLEMLKRSEKCGCYVRKEECEKFRRKVDYRVL